MKKTEITIAGQQYPVQFDFQTLLNFENITKKSFFGATFEMTTERMALIMAAVLSADENTSLTIEGMVGQKDWEAVKEIITAYGIIMNLANDFFHIPEVVKQSEEDEYEGQKDDAGEQPKNG
jgi:hypothetical protein